MKILKRIVLTLVVVLIGVFALQMIASESAEVVVLSTRGETDTETTRLWVVDYHGLQWLRAEEGSGWLERLTANPTVKLRRGDDTASYRAEPDRQLSDEINRLMREKYGWRDAFISGVIGGRDASIAVRLIPITESARAKVPGVAPVLRPV